MEYERWDITTDGMNNKRIIKQHSMSHSMSTNLITDKINQFFERHNVPELTQEEIDNLSKSVSIK